MIYVANYADSVTVIDGARHTAVTTIHVGNHPQAIAVDSAANLIYVASTRSRGVVVIDGKKNVAIYTLETAWNPYSICADSSSGKAFVASLGDPTIAMLETRGVHPRPTSH